MKCEEAGRYLSPYLDSELDPKTSFEMSSHFEQCLSCRDRFESERRIEYAMSVELKKGMAKDAEHWNRAKSAAFRHKAGAGRLWAFGLLAVVVLAIAFVAVRQRPVAGLAEDLRNEWTTFEAGRGPLEIDSSDPAAAETFCRERLGLALRVPGKIGGLELEGARRCSLRGAGTAFFSYRNSARRVMVFVFSADHLDRYSASDQVRSPIVDDRQDVGVLALRSGWKVICAVGSASVEELNAAAKAFQDP